MLKWWSEEVTFLSRLQSFIEKYRTEILAGAGTIVSTIGIPLVGIIMNKKIKKGEFANDRKHRFNL